MTGVQTCALRSITLDQLFLANASSSTSTAARLSFQGTDALSLATTTGAISGILTQDYQQGARGDLIFSTLLDGVLTEAGRITSSGSTTFTGPLGITTATASSTINGGLEIGSAAALRLADLNCATFANGGTLTAAADGIVTCADDNGPALAFGQAWEVTAAADAIAPTTSVGIIVAASSTI